MRRILFAALMGAFAVGIAAAQSSPSIFLIDSSTGGPKAAGGARVLESQLYQDIRDKYPCLDMLDRKEAEALIEYQRMVDLLGGKPNEQLLGEIGGAMGATYVINVHVQLMDNGMYYMQVSVFDPKASRFVVMQDAPPVGESGVLAAMDALRARAADAMGSYLNGKCDEHWTGSISFNYKFNESGPKPTNNVFSGGDAANVKSKWDQTITVNDDIYVMLRPMSLGTNGPLNPKAQVTRQFEYHFNSKYEATMQVRCRPRGANSYLRPTTERRVEKMDETGESKAVRIVRIYVYDSGKYTIRLDSPLDIRTKWTREDTEQRPGGCEDPAPVTATSKGEDSVYAGSYKRAGGDIEGQVDPKNPNILAGKITSGNADIGIQTITWNLRRVKPKVRGEK